MIQGGENKLSNYMRRFESTSFSKLLEFSFIIVKRKSLQRKPPKFVAQVEGR